MKHKNIALILISALLLLSGCNSDALTESKDEHLQSSEITSQTVDYGTIIRLLRLKIIMNMEYYIQYTETTQGSLM